MLGWICEAFVVFRHFSEGEFQGLFLDVFGVSLGSLNFRHEFWR